MRDYTTKGPKKVVQINEKELLQHLSTLVADTVQEVLNQVLDAEANEMVGAARYERSTDRQDYRSGSYARKLQTKAGGSDAEHTQASGAGVPDGHNRALQATGVIDRRSFGEMYLAGVSTRRVADITEALWDTRVSSATVSKLKHSPRCQGSCRDF